jgi:hypothetical protein
MTPAERQRRRRERLRAEVRPEAVVAYVVAQLNRSSDRVAEKIIRLLRKEITGRRSAKTKRAMRARSRGPSNSAQKSE